MWKMGGSVVVVVEGLDAEMGLATDHGEEGEVGALPRWPAVFIVVV